VKKLSEWVMTRLGPDVPLHSPPSILTTRCWICLYAGLHPDEGSRYRREVGLHFVYTGNVHDADFGFLILAEYRLCQVPSRRCYAVAGAVLRARKRPGVS